jgi:hypothetical protein
MPSYALAEPFVVEVNYKAEGVHGLGVGFDRSWKRLPEASTWTPGSFCLGEGAYGESPNGGEVEVRIAASEQHENCYDEDLESSVRIDHFTIRPAGADECLEPGSVLNGRAEADGEPWGFFTEGDAEAGFASTQGRDGTSGARLTRGEGETGRATMTTQISVPVPATLASPALRFWWRGTSGAIFDVELGTRIDLGDRGRRVDTLVGTGSGLRYLYCLPPWTHGSVLDLSFSLPELGSGEVDLVIDDVEIVSNTLKPSCGNDEDLFDPGFESAPNHWLGTSVSSIFDTVLLPLDDPLARSGDGLLEFRYESADAELAMETYVLVPPSKGEEGPALAFYSLSPATPSSEVQWVLGRSEVETDEVKTEITWEPNVVCLPPRWAGRWFRVQVRVRSPKILLGQERVLLDDFSVGTSPSCLIQ